MNVYEAYETNSKIEQEGVLIEVGVNGQGKAQAIRVAFAGGANTKYTKLLEQRTKKYRRAIEAEVMDPKLLEQIFIEVYAETVVLGWENMEDRDGKPLPFTPEACIKLFKALPHLFRIVREDSQRIALFRQEVQKEEQGK